MIKTVSAGTAIGRTARPDRLIGPTFSARFRCAQNPRPGLPRHGLLESENGALAQVDGRLVIDGLFASNRGWRFAAMLT